MNQPIVVSTRVLVTILLGVMMLAAGVAIAASRLASPQPADAATSSAAVVKQLKSVNTKLTRINHNIGDYDYTGSSLRRNTKDTASSVEAMCRSVSSSPSGC